MPNTFTVLELCTNHVTKDVAEALDERFLRGVVYNDPEDWVYWIVGSPWSEHGWWIWADVEDVIDDLPPCLKHALNFAKDHGCRWVQFDADVAPIDDLPTWEW